jgi:hypothetical protein
MNLDSRNAQRLVDEIGQATTAEDARERSSRAWDFLLAQFHLLCDRANGYAPYRSEAITVAWGSTAVRCSRN